MGSNATFRMTARYCLVFVLCVALMTACFVPIASVRAVADPEISNGSDAENQTTQAPTTDVSESSSSNVASSSTGDKPESANSSASKQNQSQESAQSADQDTAAQPAAETAVQEALQKISKADEALASANTRAGELAGLKSRFSTAYAEYSKRAVELKTYKQKRESAGKAIDDIEQDMQRAQSIIDAANLELAFGDGYGLLAVMVGVASFDDIEARPYMLRIVIESEQEIIDSARPQLKLLKAEQTSYGALYAKARRNVDDVVANVNAAAYEIERCSSLGRQAVNDTRSITDSLDTSLEGVAEGKSRIISTLASDSSVIGDAEGSVGAWYDELDALSGTNGAISYGQGIDFSMNEAAFVQKWGDAIDAFYADYSVQMGSSPLNGYGKKIATEAYRYKIDPRLCAAVSIAESSGGRICIKPYNAWGWGAADSDPYNLAKGWSSWDEAIEAWHQGMATSTTGLATAPTVSSLAAIYCSSPVWGVTVITQMERISERAAVG
jgi:hypothetical protein